MSERLLVLDRYSERERSIVNAVFARGPQSRDAARELPNGLLGRLQRDELVITSTYNRAVRVVWVGSWNQPLPHCNA